MAEILLGDEGCGYKEIVDIFVKNDSINHQMLEWSLMAFSLNINQIDITIIKRRDKTPQESIYDVLELWRSKNAEKSTLGNFLQCLPRHWNQLKEYVRDLIYEKAKTWKDLDIVLQDRLGQTTVRLLGRECTFKSLGVILDDKMLKEHLPEYDQKRHMFSGVFECDKLIFPMPFNFYINRKLTIRQQLKPNIFMENCKDIFVFEGIERYKLCLLDKANQCWGGQQEPTDDSNKQVRKNKLTVRFIRLTQPNDFSKIVAKRDTRSVHRIKYNDADQTFNWIATIGSIKLISEFLSDRCRELPEENFINDTLSIFNSRPIAICSSPGMGKSFLLKSLANQMKHNFPKRLVIFLPFKKLIPRLRHAEGEMNTDFVIDTLANEFTSCVLGSVILNQKLKDQSTECELFLDGFDEIASDSFERAKEFLKLLLTTENIRCHITSRPHMTNELERTAGVVSYNIAPFTSEDQKDFFCAKWEHSLKITNYELLSKFALKLLKSPTLQNAFKSVYGEIAGIPLQCDMLAQVCSDHVVNFCEGGNVDYEIFNCTYTLFELYSTFMEYKFKYVISDVLLVKKFHWIKSMEYLFPKCHEASLIKKTMEMELHEKPGFLETIFSVGILETSRDWSNPEFLHRTFAEFLLAEFITEVFLKSLPNLKNEWTSFVYDTVLKKKSEIEDNFDSEVVMRHHSGAVMDKYVDMIMYSAFWESSEDFAIHFQTLQEQMEARVSHLRDIRLAYPRPHLPRQSDKMRMALMYMVIEMDDLLFVMQNLGWFQIADAIERAAAYQQQECTFLHSTICFFLDTLLMEYQSVLETKQENKFAVTKEWFFKLNEFSKQFMLKLITCVTEGFGNLARLVLRLCNEKVPSNENEIVQIDQVCCRHILFLAASHDDREFFMHCCKMVESLSSVKLGDAEFDTSLETQYCDIRFKHTPLHVAVGYGNCNVTEYLLTTDQFDCSRKDGLWQACLHQSSKDPQYILQQKKQILYLLKSKDMIVNFDTKNYQNFPFEVNSNLFQDFCEVVGYLPREEDNKLIGFYVLQFCDKTGSQMDSFVDWVRANGVESILTYRAPEESSLLNFALKCGVVKPETFSKIFSLVPFDPNFLLRNATYGDRGEAMINIIVELTGIVNHVDVEDKCGTLLHFSVQHENTNAVKYLLREGASVHLKDSKGNTPLHLALLKRRPVPEIVKELIRHSSNIHARNLNRKTPLSLAFEKNDTQKEIMEMLREKVTYNLRIILVLWLAYLLVRWKT